jgi:hypothetical protein
MVAKNGNFPLSKDNDNMNYCRYSHGAQHGCKNSENIPIKLLKALTR